MIHHEITLGVGTKQPHFVVLPDVGIHHRCIVGEVSAMWAKHIESGAKDVTQARCHFDPSQVLEDHPRHLLDILPD